MMEDGSDSALFTKENSVRSINILIGVLELARMAQSAWNPSHVALRFRSSLTLTLALIIPSNL